MKQPKKSKRTDPVPPAEAARASSTPPAPLVLDRAFLADVRELLGPLRELKATILRAAPDLAGIRFEAIDAEASGDALCALEARAAPLLDRVRSTLDEQCESGRAGDDGERLQSALAGARLPLHREAEALDRVEEWIGALQLFETRGANEQVCTPEAIEKRQLRKSEGERLNRRKKERERALEVEAAPKLAEKYGDEDDGGASINACFSTSVEGQKEGNTYTSLRINTIDLLCPDGTVVPLQRRATDQEIELGRRAREIVKLAQEPAGERQAARISHTGRPVLSQRAYVVLRILGDAPHRLTADKILEDERARAEGIADRSHLISVTLRELKDAGYVTPHKKGYEVTPPGRTFLDARAPAS